MSMKRPSLRDVVPPRRRDVLFVQSPDAGERVKFICYSSCFYGVYTHYSGKTCPCYEDHTLCLPEHSELNLRWKGYLHGWSHTRNEPVIMQFTVEAANQLVEQLSDRAVLRGLTIEVSRTAKKKGRMNCQVIGAMPTTRPDQLPPPIDPLRSLYNMWGLPFRTERLRAHLSGDPPAPNEIVKIA